MNKDLRGNGEPDYGATKLTMRGTEQGVLRITGFGSTFGENLRELFKGMPGGTVDPGVVGFPFHWAGQAQFRRLQALSVSFHVLLLVLLVVPFMPGLSPIGGIQGIRRPATKLEYIPKMFEEALRAKDAPHGGGGGGERNPIPASTGAIPGFASIQLTPPSVKPPQDPKMEAPPTLLGSPDLQVKSQLMPNWGDPSSNSITDSSGPGFSGGIGTGERGGVGPGKRGGLGPGEDGGSGDGTNYPGRNGYGYPACVYCPNPQFTDEAVKTKLQGTVILLATITTEGRAINIRVVQSLGLGLDEEAVKAVRTWRFTPARGPDGRPATVSAPIEVRFRLY
jgi:TonB family protein